MKIKRIAENFMKVGQIPKLFNYCPKQCSQFRPTVCLGHPLLQSIYNLVQPKINYSMAREKLFFEDGGHISLDWQNKTTTENFHEHAPILFIMHGLTGGSQMNYMKILMQKGQIEGFRSVCMNSRGINNEMTSPIPFTGIEYHQLNKAFDHIENLYPNAPIYMIGTSFGGNYLMRYLLNNDRKSIKGLVALAPPLDIKKSVDEMSSIYQKFFVKRYINETVLQHPEMLYWQKIGVVDMNQVKKSQTLRQFHSRMTVKIMGLSDVDQLFDSYLISKSDIQKINVPTLMMTSKDDPIVTYKNYPIEEINRNKNIQLITTQKGGHLCWFEGIVPKRWYPKPTFEFLNKLKRKNEIF